MPRGLILLNSRTDALWDGEDVMTRRPDQMTIE